MSDQLVRFTVVLAIAGLALLIAAVARRVKRPVHPEVTVGDIGDRPGVVLFTSTNCGLCKETIAVLESESIAFREVTYDLEPHRFELWMVVAVPLTVVVDSAGGVVATFTGVPKRRDLRRAASSARVGAS